MQHYNLIVLEGFSTRESTTSYTKKGKLMLRFSLANHSWMKDEQGKNRVSYFSVICWDRLAEIMAQYIKKGTRLIVTGRIEQSQWTDQTGMKRTNIAIHAQDISFVPNTRTKQNPEAPTDEQSVHQSSQSSPRSNPASPSPAPASVA